MAGHAVTPNVISYNAAISSCEWQMAVHLFDCMETDRRWIGSDWWMIGG